MFSQAIPKPYNNVHDDEQLALGHKGIWVITQNALHALFSTAPPPLPAFPPTVLVEGRQHSCMSYCTA